MTTTRGEYAEVFGVYWPIAVGVFVLVSAALVFLVVRHRSDSDEFPSGRDESNPLEIGYAVVLIAVAAGLLVVSFGAGADVSNQFERSAEVRVEVTGSRWNWRFEYPELGVVEQGTRNRVPVLRVPAGEPVDFEGTSRDVQHAFWVPDERFKRDVFAGRTTTWQLTFDQPGFHEAAGSCAEFCGLRHTDMRFNVEVLPPSEFERWARLAGAPR